MPAAVATPLPPRKRKYTGNRWPDGVQADPGLLLQAKAQRLRDQYGQQAFAEIAEQGQDGEFFPRQAQHVGRAGVA